MSFALDQLSIVIPIAPDETAHEQLLKDLQEFDTEILVCSEGSRAKSLNAGAAQSTRPFLWFLHADSRVSKDNLSALGDALQNRAGDLHYFDLAYHEGGLPSLNAGGANLRSRLFGTPYGDQGFCLAKTQYTRIAGFPEDAPYGEDLLFVRRATQAGIKLHRIPVPLISSARKYHQQGWLKLTALRQWQLFKLMRQDL